MKRTFPSFWLSCKNQVLLAGDGQHLNGSEVWPPGRRPSRPHRLPDIRSQGGAVSHQRDGRTDHPTLWLGAGGASVRKGGAIGHSARRPWGPGRGPGPALSTRDAHGHGFRQTRPFTDPSGKTTQINTRVRDNRGGKASGGHVCQPVHDLHPGPRPSCARGQKLSELRLRHSNVGTEGRTPRPEGAPRPAAPLIPTSAWPRPFRG